jgi:RNA polymerase sigma factor (sigma-70 family)
MTITFDPLVTSDQRVGIQEAQALVAAAAAGDERAWNEIVEQFGSMIWAITRAHRLSDADAADVTQATWLKLIDHLGRLQEPGRVGAWLATTARRECLCVLRRVKTTVFYGDNEPEIASEEDEDVALRLMTAERDQALWICFARLRDTDQALLLLLVSDPAPSYEEISAALAMPVGSIGPTRARALARLRAGLERDGELLH